MQLHELKAVSGRTKRRVGRGGKRGTFSGRGSKGQKSRSGTRIRPGFRGGDNPLWKLFPKQRGASKKTDIKRALFQMAVNQVAIVNLKSLNAAFKEGEKVSKKSLLKKGLIATSKHGVKILGSGELKKKLVFEKDITFSKSAREQIK
jgi:large subunit ribosomal protein L15